MKNQKDILYYPKVRKIILNLKYPKSQIELYKNVNFSLGDLSKQLKKLIDKGFIKIKKQADKRKNIYYLTQLGEFMYEIYQRIDKFNIKTR
jgi:predicted transcriptional regulator